MTSPLEYASPSNAPRLRWHRKPLPLAIFDAIAGAFLISQLAFLLEMTIVNIGECGVAPYGDGYSYLQSALGNNTFVRSFPDLAARIVRIPRKPLDLLGRPSYLANAFTLTGFTWIVAAYLVWRVICTRGRRRAVLVFIALPLLATLPWILPALMVQFD